MTLNKKILLFFDGTGNEPDMKEYGRPCPTNVFRLFEATVRQYFSEYDGEYSKVEPSRIQVLRQILGLSNDEIYAINDHEFSPEPTSAANVYIWYTAGVGVSSGNIISGGSTGKGTSAKVKKGYEKILLEYIDGAEIYLFGFSRGAYAACLLADMIRRLQPLSESIDSLSGLPDKNRQLAAQHLAKVAVEKYKNGCLADPVESENKFVHFLGLWDTVAALKGKAKIQSIPEVEKSAKHISHAVAIDELREKFKPELFCSTKDNDNVNEVWFVGAHSNVGGGYSTSGLSDITLHWMIQQLDEGDDGLSISEESLGLDLNEAGVLRNEIVDGFIFQWIGKPKRRKIEENAIIHSSVKERILNRSVTAIEQTYLKRKMYRIYNAKDKTISGPELMGVDARDSYRLDKYVRWRNRNATWGMIATLVGILSLALTYWVPFGPLVSLLVIAVWCVARSCIASGLPLSKKLMFDIFTF